MTSVSPYKTLAALIFADRLQPTVSLSSVGLDEEGHLIAYSITNHIRPIFGDGGYVGHEVDMGAVHRSATTMEKLRALFLAEGENAVRERLGLTPLPLRVWTDEYEWYIGASLDDVRVARTKGLGEPSESDWPAMARYVSEEDWHALPDDEELKRWTEEIGHGELQAKTCAEWVAERGRGFLCSTEC